METDTKYYSNKQNAVRAARKVLGAEAKPHVDFYLLGGNTHWQWQIRELGPMAEVATKRGDLEQAVDAFDRAAQMQVEPIAVDAPPPGTLEEVCAFVGMDDHVVEAPADAPEALAAFAAFERMGERMSAEAPAERKPRAPNQGLVALVILMKRAEGTTLAEAQAATGWLPHTIRSRIAVDVVRKQGHKVERVRKDGASVYRIVE